MYYTDTVGINIFLDVIIDIQIDVTLVSSYLPGYSK